ncbi:hypothetical protein FOIG_02027 [Fusarium odoratissimum NRRL 54006]|uniref:Uncharacterized protein n=2 Tax=Fusarium oxysporum species complex TaxID=171631 RepID=X0LK86_FUSO5|nr:uncharacterized protein FOIG_02027 [Fusarium odoratissimum NRRL 54006]EXM09045.1 hypothetical protein FOIG_02027 [Fusarium odoratissimum NRRL 54006]TXC06687.1 hypothetical protein FocTR4_00009914 [Fusarium oxysporum f. sp. cubense]
MRVHPPIHMRCAIGPPFQIYPTPHDVTFVSANSQCSSHAYPTSSLLDVPRNDFLLMDAKKEPRAKLSLAIPLTSLFTGFPIRHTPCTRYLQLTPNVLQSTNGTLQYPLSQAQILHPLKP